MSSAAPEPMARLSCGHYQRVSVEQARYHRPLMCVTCRTDQRPDTVLIREWYVYCRDCGWDRWMGQLKWEARKARERHLSGVNWDHFVTTDYATLPGLEYTQLITPTATPTTPSEDDNNDRDHRPHLF